jgi:hypothetical protein
VIIADLDPEDSFVGWHNISGATEWVNIEKEISQD